ARLMTIGRANRLATAEELEQMKAIIEGAMKDGAYGISTALIYVPAVFSNTEELIELSRVAARYGGSYFSHIRNEADEIDSALDEAFRIGREAQIPVNIWHLKIGGQHNWGKMPAILEKIQQQRANGLDVAANVYPYIASSTGLSALAPNWALEGGYGAFLKRLQDPALRKRIGEDISNSSFYHRLGDASGILVADIPGSAYDNMQKKRLSEIAQLMGVDPIEAALRLLEAGESSPGAIYFTMHEGDVQAALRTPWVSVGSDSGAFVGDVNTEGAHPRGYGTFPRVIGRYVRDERLFTLEEAVRKVTSQAAARIQLQDRGLLRPGMKADIVVFDPDQLLDVSTFEDPHHFSKGITDVIVNGVFVLRAGEMTGALPGRMLKKDGDHPR
ncbi:MAG TPA: amidohydrolase family protein, partial [Thermoanaerobaculia bacterium]|nr:amidohydrolase family protein [Thermoanaerobaculia bacterium]